MTDWNDDTRHVPLFEAALLTGGYRVSCVSADGQAFVEAQGCEYEIMPNDRPDLTDPVTANEALRLLALEMGAPAELVEMGVVFAPVEDDAGCMWWIGAGVLDREKQHATYWARTVAQSITDRPAAIARAWAEHRGERPVITEDEPEK